MAIYCWTGNLQGNYWFSDERGPTAAMNYSKDINKIENGDKVPKMAKSATGVGSSSPFGP